MSLPILTLDEHLLSPSFGYVFHRHWLAPFESIVGMLWKFAHMNRLPGHTVVTRLCRDPIDPYEGIALAEIDVVLVARLLGVTQRRVRAGIGRVSAGTSKSVRFCPRCLTLAYHAVLHQLERFGRCPIHGIPLQAACHGCTRTSQYRLDAQLLDAPFRCRHCRRYYTSSGTAPCFRHAALSLKNRMAITRAVLS